MVWTRVSINQTSTLQDEGSKQPNTHLTELIKHQHYRTRVRNKPITIYRTRVSNNPVSALQNEDFDNEGLTCKTTGGLHSQEHYLFHRSGDGLITKGSLRTSISYSQLIWKDPTRRKELESSNDWQRSWRALIYRDGLPRATCNQNGGRLVLFTVTTIIKKTTNGWKLNRRTSPGAEEAESKTEATIIPVKTRSEGVRVWKRSDRQV